MTRLHLDYETASELNLKTVGAYKYAMHPSTRILMLGWAFDDDEAALWEPHKGPIPTELLQGIKASGLNKHAFNAQFERLISRYVLGADVPYEQWRCTMVEAFYLGFSGRMDMILEAIGLEKKDKRGGQLINMFCTPAPKNHKAEWYDWDNRPDEWEEFGSYCRQDVKVERQLWHFLQQFPQIPEWDLRQWFLDQKINDRGVPMDLRMAEASIELWDEEKRQLTEELAEVTGLPKVTSGPFKEYMQGTFGIELDSLRKEYLASLLMKGELPDAAQHLVNLWAQKEAKAVSKYTAVQSAICDDGRARGMFQYKGASRTDRAGGRIIQLQNLKRPFVKETGIETLVDAIKLGDPLLIRTLYGMGVSEVLGGAVRHVIEAPKGKTFIIADLSSIESVVLGWLCYCDAIDRTFREGKDSYRVFASAYFNINYDDVTKAQRSFSKPPVLGAGFMLGWKGLIAYAEGYGVKMTADEAKRAIDTFRGMYPEIVGFWDWVYKALKYTVETGVACTGYRLTISRDDDFLRILLPSGRSLSYYKPEFRMMPAPWDRKQLISNFTYMGTNQDNPMWTRISAHAGGVTENIVQSIAGDVLWNGLTNADAAGLEPVLHVHDEIGALVDINEAEQELQVLIECMTRKSHWNQDMWLGAAGMITNRYTKD
jgi:DNA polymerase bacteriophage-type